MANKKQTQKTETENPFKVLEQMRTRKFIVRTIKDGKVSDRERITLKDAMSTFNRSVGMMEKRQLLNRAVMVIIETNGVEGRIRSWTSENFKGEL